MSDVQFTIADMVRSARGENPSEFQTAFDAIILDKIAAAVETKKADIAQNYFNADETEEEEESSDTVTNEEDSNENTEATAGTEEA